MTTAYIISQVIGVIVTIICLLSPQLKRKWMMLTCTITANALSGLSFLLLGSFSATGVCAVAIIQAIIGIYHSKNNSGVHIFEVIIFSVLYIFGGLLPFILTKTLNTFTFLDGVPIFGALLLMASICQKKEQHMRMFGLSNCIVFFTYDLILQTTQIFAQIIGIVSTTTALIRYHKIEKKNKIEVNYETKSNE